ncbi:MAG: hypothetical protein ACQJCO_02950 [cyanobacterium endosymbiont of Rhopalodia sterrenbergii]
MYTLIQDVKISPEKDVHSGLVITSQQQAARPPDITEINLTFAHHVVATNESMRFGCQCTED